MEPAALQVVEAHLPQPLQEALLLLHDAGRLAASHLRGYGRLEAEEGTIEGISRAERVAAGRSAHPAVRTHGAPLELEADLTPL